MTSRITSLKPFNAYLGRAFPGVSLEKVPGGFRFIKGEASMEVTAFSFRNLSVVQWLEQARWFNSHA